MMRRLVLKLALMGAFFALVVVEARAQVATSSAAFDAFMATATGAGKTTVGFGSNGTPVVSPGVPTAQPDGGSGVKATGTGNWRNPSGNNVPITGTGRVSNGAIAGALGRFFSKVIPVLGWAAAIRDLASELDFKPSTDANGNTIWQKRDKAYCNTVGGCTEFNHVQSASGEAMYESGWMLGTRLEACQEWGRKATAGSSRYYQNLYIAADGVSCRGQWGYDGGGVQAPDSYFGEAQTRPVPQVPTVWLASTQQEFLDAIAAKSGWPTSSSIAKAAVAAAEATGEKLPVTSVTASGPATSTGTTKQNTSTNPDGSTKTSTTTVTHNHTYAGDTITTTNITNTTIINNGEAGKTTTEQGTETPETATATDTALPAQPKLYEPKYPNGPKGVWDTEVAKIKATPLFQLPVQLAPNLGDSHGCPAWTIPLSVGIVNFGSQSATIPCSVWAFMRICIIVGALFLARALIFGG